MKKIIDFNNDQVTHIQMIQKNVFDFCCALMNEAIIHDTSKFSEIEYVAFIEARDSLRGSKDGKDEEYQKHLKSKAIQHHITENKHHPEYWDKRDSPMPITQAIIMFFDWYSRCQQKGGSMSDFWKFNLEKLNCQPAARHLVEYLRAYVDNQILEEK